MIELYKQLKPYFHHVDPRGSLTGLLRTGSWREVNFITSQAGSIRGGHYHKVTKECFIILSGRISVKFKLPIDNNKAIDDQVIFIAGDVFIVNVNVEHTFEVLEDSQWINLLEIPLDQENLDFYKYNQV